MMVRECSTHRGEEIRIQGFGGKPEAKKSLGRPRRRWENKMKLKKWWDWTISTRFIWLVVGTIGGLL
jgi:hypothetical protein